MRWTFLLLAIVKGKVKATAPMFYHKRSVQMFAKEAAPDSHSFADAPHSEDSNGPLSGALRRWLQF